MDFTDGMKATTKVNHFDSSLRDRYFRKDNKERTDASGVGVGESRKKEEREEGR